MGQGILGHVTAIIVATTACAKGEDPKVVPDASSTDAEPSCVELCDADGDGVFDPADECPGTLTGAPVNTAGCSDAQVDPVLATEWPPFGLTWTPTGNLGRAGGLTWTYTGIQRADLFHIAWVACDDPMPHGISLDGPLDMPDETWVFSAADSDLIAGKLVLTNTTRIQLDGGTTNTLAGRVTLMIRDASDTPLLWKAVAELGIPAAPPRGGTHGAEITGTGFVVTALAEVQDPTTLTWSPFLDYFDAAPTPPLGPMVAMSFGGSFYSE